MPGRLPSRQQFSCTSCPLSFLTKGERRAHNRRAHPRCARCSRKFDDAGEFIQHQMSKSHCYCGTCNVHFPRVTDHLEHIRRPGHPIQYKCDICERQYPDEEALNEHCCDCDRLLTKRERLEQHFLEFPSHHRHLEGLIDPNISCSYCGNTFNNEEKLHLHLSVEHGLVSCPVSLHCQQVFARPMDLLRHFGEGRCPSKMSLIDVHKHVASEVPASQHISSMDPEDWIVSLFKHCPQNSYDSPNRPAAASTVAQPIESESLIKVEKHSEGESEDDSFENLH